MSAVTKAPAADGAVAALRERVSRPAAGSRARWAWPVGLAAVAVLAVVPLLGLDLPGLLPGPLDSPGTLQLLALCLVFGTVALSYDLLFGRTGLLSFGHALFFAAGAYTFDIALTRWHWGPLPALGLVVAVGVGLSAVLGAVSLRVGGIAFAMVTLAFAQSGSILVQRDPGGLTGGDEGLGLVVTRLPDGLVGVLNTKHLYWLVLGLLVAVYLAIGWANESSPGRVWAAIRDNEPRVEVLGLRPYPFKLLAFTLSGVIAGLAGVGYALLTAGATPAITTPDFTLAILVMVIIGGVGSRWGVVAGAALYEWLSARLAELSGSVGQLPAAVRVPLSEPLFVLGVVFVLVVYFLPGGIAGAWRRVVSWRR